jgi:hypothetical protein
MLRIRPEQVRLLAEVPRRKLVRLLAGRLRLMCPDEIGARFGADNDALLAFVDAVVAETAVRGIEAEDDVLNSVFRRLVLPEQDDRQDAAPMVSGMPPELTALDPVEAMPEPKLVCRFTHGTILLDSPISAEIWTRFVPGGTPALAELLRVSDENVVYGTLIEISGPLTRAVFPSAAQIGVSLQDGLILRIRLEGGGDTCAIGVQTFVEPLPGAIGDEDGHAPGA